MTSPTKDVICYEFTATLMALFTALAGHFKSAGLYDSLIFAVRGADLKKVRGLTSFDTVAAIDTVVEPLLDWRDPDAVRALARENEKKYRLDFIDAYRADRLAGRGFIAAVWIPESSNYSARSYIHALAYFNASVTFYERLFSQRRVACLIGYPGGLDGGIATGMARAFGIPCRYLMHWRARDRFAWAHDKSNLPPDLGAKLRDALREVDAAIKAGTTNLSAPAPALYQGGEVTGLDNTIGLKSLRREMYAEVRRNVGHVVKRRVPGLKGRYSFPQNLWLILRMWQLRRRNWRRRPRAPYRPPGPYVLFPLQVEPEITLSVEADTVVSQLSVIEWLAQSMPAGWTLVVKEHPFQTALRRRFFWRYVRGLPNTAIAPTLAPTEPLIANAAAVATINSTVGYQAAAAGIPVLTFDAQTPLSILPHVFPAASYADTRRIIRRIADVGISREDRNRGGLALKTAWDRIGFELGLDYEAAFRTNATLQPELVARIGDELHRSIQESAAAQVRAVRAAQ